MQLKRLLDTPILDSDDVLKSVLKISASYIIGLSSLSVNALSWDTPNNKAVRVGMQWLGVVTTAYGLYKTRQLQNAEMLINLRKVAREDLLAEKVALQMESNNELSPQLLSNNSSELVQHFDVMQFLQEVTGIAILGNSGSGKTQLAKYIAGHCNQSQIIILDPHFDPDNNQWEGLTVISDYDQILTQLEILLELLNEKDKTNLVVIADEYPAIRAYAKRQKTTIADDFILRYGSEARKFNKLPIFISQSGNTKALGLEGMGDFLENFALVRLQKVAHKHAKNLSNQDILAAIKQTPYPMLIGDDSLVVHPTHGHYQQVAKNQPPINLKPLTSIPITIPLVNSKKLCKLTETQPEDERIFLENCWVLDSGFQPREPREPMRTQGIDPYPQDQNPEPKCPDCGGYNIKRNGFTGSGKPKYKCKDCNKNWS